MKSHLVILIIFSAWNLVLMWLIWLVVGGVIYFLAKKYVRSALVKLIEAESDEYLNGERYYKG